MAITKEGLKELAIRNLHGLMEELNLTLAQAQWEKAHKVLLALTTCVAILKEKPDG